MMATGNIPWRRATQGTMAPACMQTNPNWTCSDEVPTLPEVLKLLSFNIQVGINTQRYHHYLTRGWQHLLPHARRQQTLAQIAQLISEFDVVALQEVDGRGHG